MRKPVESDIYFINSHRELAPNDLVKATGLTLNQVKKILEVAPEVTEKTTKPESQFLKSAMRRTGKGNHGVFVMTEGASQVVDETRKVGKDTSSYICKAKP